VQKVHLDTDIGGDIDDLCALALLLRWPGVELTGVTTVAENEGRRAGYARYVLDHEGKADVPVAAGADNAGGYYPYFLGLPREERYWPEAVTPIINPPDKAVELLKNSIEQGALIIGIGPLTNLALVERRYPGSLARARLYLMGGYVYPTRTGFPPWGNDMDFNVQIDVHSSRIVLEASTPTLIPLTMTVETALRRAHLSQLRQAGFLGALIARQAEAFALDEQIAEKWAATCPGLPPDLINFQHDPLAVAIALSWRDGVEIEALLLTIGESDGLVTETIDPAGRPMRVVTKIDGPRFNQFWLDQVTRTG
jgi:inosine-uridine nucleoside N-ribohydrolase